jgi:hypothetical protein
MSLKVPKVPAGLRLPISALIRAAAIFRGVLVKVGEGAPLDRVLSEHGEDLLTAERVIDTWAAAMGIDFENN